MPEKKSQHPTELKLPQQAEAFKQMNEDNYQLHLDKNADYSPANILIAGEIGVLIRVWDKFCRLCNLYGITFPTPQPVILDLIDCIEGDLNQIHQPLSHEDIVAKLKEIAKQCEFDFSKAKEKEAKNEPIEDAWRDMEIYSKIGLLKRLGKWGR